jgi:hypothetical protein
LQTRARRRKFWSKPPLPALRTHKIAGYSATKKKERRQARGCPLFFIICLMQLRNRLPAGAVYPSPSSP